FDPNPGPPNSPLWGQYFLRRAPHGRRLARLRWRDGAPGARLGPASSHARGRGGALVLQPHALGSHPGVSVLRAGVLAREPLARLRNGAWRQPGPAPPPRP